MYYYYYIIISVPIRPPLLPVIHQNNYEIHNEIHKKFTNMPYKCPECNRCFKREGNLTNHLAVHYGTTHKCHDCNKQFIRKSCLDSHRKNMHSSSKYIECQYCKKRFGDRKSLKHHIKNKHIQKLIQNMVQNTIVIHSDNICDICSPSKNFATSDQLRVHQLRKHNIDV